MPNTTLAELTKTNAPAVLVELAYRQSQDEVWITNNIEGIARNLAQSVCEYCGVSFGMLETLGSLLWGWHVLGLILAAGVHFSPFSIFRCAVFLPG